MATALYNAQQEKTTAQQREAELHNAQIRERYLRLQNAEAVQFAEHTQENESEYTVRASVLSPEREFRETPVTEQVPQITEYTRTRVDSPVFTTEKFNSIQEQTQAPVIAQATVMPVQAPAVVAQIRTEPQYSLSNLAKMVIAAFTALVVMMFALICVNTQIISRKAIQLNALEQERAELIERNAEFSRRIQEAKSEETIREYAESNGMILGQE